jgi:hypothetical protein
MEKIMACQTCGLAEEADEIPRGAVINGAVFILNEQSDDEMVTHHSDVFRVGGDNH